MAIEPRASQRGSSVKWASRTPLRAKKRPISAPVSSSSTTGSSGSFAVRIHDHHETPGGRRCLASRYAVRSEIGLEHDGEQEDADRDPQALDLVRIAQLGDALVQGEQAAHREQHEGDDERPEVALAPVSEGMLDVGGLAGALASEQQQRLVAGVGKRVDGLGEQSGGAR